MYEVISVIGGSECDNEVANVAEEVGAELAKQGVVVICGGLGGVMAAVCKGARAAGGITVGILPGDDRNSANPDVLIPVVTGLGYARNSIVAKSAQAVIAINGSYGTLCEIAHALQDDIPIVGLNTWSMSIDGQVDGSIIPAKHPKDAVKKAIALARKRSGGTIGTH